MLENRKSGNVVGSFLYFIANVNDPYLISLKLIREEDYLFFMENDEENTDLKERMIGFSDKFEENLRKTMNSDYLYREEVVIKETSEILDQIDDEINFSVLFRLKISVESKKIQRILSEMNIPFKVFNILSVFIEYGNYLRLFPEFQAFFSKYSAFLQFFLNNNSENHCSFFLEEKFWSLENSLYQCPLEISTLLFEIFIKDPMLLITKKFMLDVLCEMLLKSHKKIV